MHKKVLFLATFIFTGLLSFGQINFTEHVSEIPGGAMAQSAKFPIDMDGDGDLDFAWQYYDFWFENDGNQNFTERTVDNFPVVPTGYTENRYLVDMENDGDLDYISSHLGTTTWMKNVGNNTFVPVVLVNVPYTYSSAPYDIDQDGDIDFFSRDFSTSPAQWFWYENDGNQNFVEKSLAIDAPNGLNMEDFNDFDNDGDLDIIKLNSDYSSGTSILKLYENDGSQNFTEYIIDTSVNGLYEPNSFHINDFDDDGDKDIFFTGNVTANGQGNYPSYVYWYENTGGFNLTKHTLSNFSNTAGTIFTHLTDINNDGHIDIVWGGTITNPSLPLRWYENDGSQNFSEQIVDSNAGRTFGLKISDLNIDGYIDIVFRGKWYKNDGNGNFTIKTLDTSVPISSNSYTTVDDLDNDGDFDVLLTNEDIDFVWFENSTTSKSVGDFAYTAPLLGSYNYVYSVAPQKEMTTIDTTTVIKNKDVIESVNYFDGLGRPLQQVAIRAGGKGEDIITPITYDQYGRQLKDYLPYNEAINGAEKYREDLPDKIRAYYWSKYYLDFNNGNISYEESNAYSEKSYENSPLNRMLEQGAPGSSWIVDKENDTDHTIKFEYKTNELLDSVRFFDVTFVDSLNTEAPSLTETGVYDLGELFKTVTKDENWQPGQTHDKDHTTEEFKDKQGMVVIKRAYNLNQPHDTYYVYDDYNNLTYVIPPKAADETSISQTILDELCYQYKYDDRNRLIEKKIPGKGLESIVYDKLDRPILTNDANLASEGKWLFTKYDAFGRVAYTGVFTTGITVTRLSLQNQLDNAPIYQFEERQGPISVGGATINYTSRTFPNLNLEVFTVNYYDDYNFTEAPFNPSINPKIIFNVSTTTAVKSLATGSCVKVLDTNDWINTTTYYDEKARPIYTHSTNEFLNTVDEVQSKLDFTGRVLKTRTNHINNNNAEPEIVTQDTFTYDQAGRVLKQIQCIGGADLDENCGGNGADGVESTLVTSEAIEATESKIIEASNFIILQPGFVAKPVVGEVVEVKITAQPGAISGSQVELIAENTYNELGQLVRKKVGNNESNPLQNVDYIYNIRGWLRSINNTDGYFNSIGFTDTNDLFGMHINYDLEWGSGPVSLYNGNISKILWKTANTDASLKSYDFTYDALNRITSGVDNSVNAKFSVGINGYDKNGNIQGIFRQGHIVENPDINTSTDFGLMDNLGYNYYPNSNKLQSVQELIGGNATYGFKDGATQTIEYNYDANGNMQVDENKGITNISYNHLNLPTTITVNGQNISYIYDATGVKLRKTVNGTTTDYAGNYVYEKVQSGNPILQFFNHPEGYVTPDQSSFKYIYQYKDHLGNIRLSYIDADGDGKIAQSEIIEENNYYPFGLKHRGYNTNVGPGGNSVANKFKYQSQEMEESLGLNNYEFGLRQYDPSLGRWFNTDPYEQFDSPYVAMGNNPVVSIDPDGGYCYDAQGNQVTCGEGEEYDDYRDSEDNHINIFDEVDINTEVEEEEEEKVFDGDYQEYLQDKRKRIIEVETADFIKKIHAAQRKGGIMLLNVLSVVNPWSFIIIGEIAAYQAVARVSSEATVISLSQFTGSTIEKAVRIIMNNRNNLRHIFAQKHNLSSVISKLGGQEKTIRAVLNALNGKLPSAGVFEKTIRVAGENIVVRGSVVKGVPRIGTMFIP